MSLATALIALDTQRNNLAANLTTMGVTAANTETLAQLVPKVLNIESGGGNLKTGTVIGNGTGTITISDVTFQPSGICITADYAEFPGNFDESGAFNIISATQFGFGSNISSVTSSGYSMTEGYMIELELGDFLISATYINNTVTFELEGPQMVEGAVAISGMTYHYAIW